MRKKMWPSSLLLVSSTLLLLLPGTSAELVKDGSTCIVTPISNTSKAAVAAPVVVGRRDDNPLAVPPAPGSPGALGRFPRPEPGSSSAGHRRRNSKNLDTRAQPDDTPQILDAFKQCGQDGTIILREGTYHIRQVMDLTNLRNVSVEIHGTLIWSADNLSYWRQASPAVTYAGRQTAVRLGGRDIAVRGFGKALFDGNGQAWIDLAAGASNFQGRPISLTVWYGTNVLIDGITWHMSQFWHTFVAHSQNVTMTNLNMSTYSSNSQSSQNTDGTNTWNSKDITISNWTVTCGDDCIGVKGNSSNVHVSNVVCHESGAMTIGSVGSNSAQPDYVENIVFDNITAIHSSNAAWIKTYPGNGYVRNVTFRNIQFEDVNQPIYVTSCIYSYNNCDSSRLKISDITWSNITGTSRYNVAAGIHCSAAAPCEGFHFDNIDIRPKDGGGAAKVLCSNIKNQADMGIDCTGPCPGSQPQQLSGNV
ncbi:polygalacturonase-like protein [Dichotomopilus funicola]|uniref:galacturonan 1,4-alpha-galacturonidase n=1 Tax=Dichotomopilus funicola TaxID=1934379 RepID=A0AAN6VB89_9PEZI|nr:polygalacturonase-like protein [Dichotomopilus funicola]